MVAESLKHVMAHPFLKMFDKALKKSSLEDNQVLAVAEKLRVKGYRPQEIFDVLKRLQKSLIDNGEAELLGEAVEEFRAYIDDDCGDWDG